MQDVWLWWLLWLLDGVGGFSSGMWLGWCCFFLGLIVLGELTGGGDEGGGDDDDVGGG